MSIKYFSVFSFLIVFILIQCKNESPKANSNISKEEQAEYIQKGKDIAMTTFSALSGQLQKAIAEGDIAQAIQYCNTVAQPIVDSLSSIHQAKIKRSSLKLRNLQNKATELEYEVLKIYEQGESELKPILKSINKEEIAFFAPIQVQGLCLKCHGSLEKDIQAGDYAIIKEFYPNDKAVNYKLGDLRGIWSIQFKK